LWKYKGEDIAVSNNGEELAIISTKSGSKNKSRWDKAA
jgi:hypothetical protein